MKILMREVLAYRSLKPVSQNLIRALDEWLNRERLYFTPGGSMLFDLFRQYDLGYFLEVISRNSQPNTSKEDAARIWRVMKDLIDASPQIA
jgi:hypothetical protein